MCLTTFNTYLLDFNIFSNDSISLGRDFIDDQAQGYGLTVLRRSPLSCRHMLSTENDQGHQAAEHEAEKDYCKYPGIDLGSSRMMNETGLSHAIPLG